MACPACDAPTRCISIDANNDLGAPVFSPTGRLRGHMGGHGPTYVYRIVCRNGCETTIETRVRRDDFMAELRGEPFRNPSFVEPPRPKKKPEPTDEDLRRGERELERIGAAVEELEP